MFARLLLQADRAGGDKLNVDLLNKPAVFSPDRKYRYTLFRKWEMIFDEPAGPSTVAFICLNPSTADEVLNDPTVTRCIRYAKKWGYGSMYMLNIFAFRSTDPLQLYREIDPIGPYNDLYILKAAEKSSLVVAGWGNHGAHLSRGWNMVKLLKGAGVQLWRLGNMTVPGQPRHPLYLKGDLKPEKL